MPSCPNLSDDDAFEGKDASDLLNDYQNLSQKYDEILRISDQILGELVGDRDQTKLLGLLNRKLETGKEIELLSQRIAGSNIQPSASQRSVLDQAKKEIEKIRSKAERLYSLERRIRKLTENS